LAIHGADRTVRTPYPPGAELGRPVLRIRMPRAPIGLVRASRFHPRLRHGHGQDRRARWSRPL